MTGQRRTSYIPPSEEVPKSRRKKIVGVTVALSLIVVGAAATPALVASAAVDAPFASASHRALHHRHHRHLKVGSLGRVTATARQSFSTSPSRSGKAEPGATASATQTTDTPSATPTATSTPTASASATSTVTATSSTVASLPDQGTVHTVSGTDASAVQSAISAAASGDTVEFPAGTYNLGRVNVKAGVLYKGESGAVLQGSGGTIVSCSSCSNTAFEGLTFDGGNVVLGADGATSTKVQFIGNTIRNVKASGFGTGQALMAINLSNSVIGGNTFTDDGTQASQNAIIGYSLASTQIIDNTMKNVYQGMHVEPRSTSGLTVSGNTLSGMTRMGIEIQGNSAALTVTDNTVGDWAGNGGNRIALSIVTHGSGTVVSGNKLTGTGITQEPGLEFMGTSSTVEGNTITGFGSSVSIACSTGTTFSGNTLSKFGQYGAFSKDGGYCGGETIGVNTVNGSSVTSKVG